MFGCFLQLLAMMTGMRIRATSDGGFCANAPISAVLPHSTWLAGVCTQNSFAMCARRFARLAPVIALNLRIRTASSAQKPVSNAPKSAEKWPNRVKKPFDSQKTSQRAFCYCIQNTLKYSGIIPDYAGTEYLFQFEFERNRISALLVPR
jgi:hypothetical protein